MRLFDGAPHAIAHRGGASYAPNVGLENTLAAFRHAARLGVRHLETDAHASRDGVAYLVHDPDLSRVGGGGHRLATTGSDDLDRVRLGADAEPVARLDTVLRELPDARLTIDVKADPAIGPVVDTVRAAGATDRVCLATFSDARMRRIRAAAPEIATSLATREVAALVLGLARPIRGAVAAQVPERWHGVPVVTRRFVDRTHALGMQVHVWTVDEAPRMHALLDLGVDGLVTDRPDVARGVLRERGVWQADADG